MFNALLAGCAHTVEFTVLRAPPVNLAPLGNTVAFGAIADPTGGPAAADVVAELAGFVQRSPNGVVRVVSANPGAVITGAIDAINYSERVEVEPRLCSRQVPLMTSSYGTTIYTTNYYSCDVHRRTGHAVLQLRLAVVDPRTQAVVFSRGYQDADQLSTSSQLGEPRPIDGHAMLHGMLSRAVSHFAGLIIPWPETVRVRFETCADDRCAHGYELVRQGNLTGAEELFTAVLDAHGAARSQATRDDLQTVSAALYDRGMTRAYLGRYEGALMDLGRAVAMRTDKPEWRQEIANVQELARQSAALRSPHAPIGSPRQASTPRSMGGVHDSGGELAARR